MPRKGPAPRRELVADPIHKSVLVTQLINKVMLHGKRTLAERIVYDAMDIIDTKSDADDEAIDEILDARPMADQRGETVVLDAEQGQLRWIKEVA